VTGKIAAMFTALKALFKKSPQRAAHLELGAWGERMALAYLKEEEGFQIVATNYRIPLGRGQSGQKMTGEIDIIAYDRNTLVFVEVKTRTSAEFAAPERAVDLRKQRQIARTARRYRQLMKITETPYRYDVVTVIPSLEENQITLFRAYFDERIFQRGRFFKQDY
jgi:putative endonuclease